MGNLRSYNSVRNQHGEAQINVGFLDNHNYFPKLFAERFCAPREQSAHSNEQVLVIARNERLPGINLSKELGLCIFAIEVLQELECFLFEVILWRDEIIEIQLDRNFLQAFRADAVFIVLFIFPKLTGKFDEL